MDVLSCGVSLYTNPELQESLDKMTSLCELPGVTTKEKQLVQAVCEWATGAQDAAADIIEDVLVAYPTDPLVATMGHSSHFFRGERERMRNHWSRCLNAWTPDMPYYSFLHGYQAFGFVETNFLQEAEYHGKKALQLNPEDGWAAHALAHVYETRGHADEGLAFMGRTERDWKGCQSLSHHNYWHWALLHILKGDFQAALGVFDSEIHPQTMHLRTAFPMTDYCSLLHRLTLEGVNIGERWDDIKEIIRPGLENHNCIFIDFHHAMACAGAKDAELTAKFTKSLEKYISEAEGLNHMKMKRFGADLLEALLAFGESNYGRVVELLYPIRLDVCHSAGSLAQNDVLTQTLIHAALRSPVPKHHRYARHMIMERKSIQPDSDMTKRLMAMELALRDD